MRLCVCYSGRFVTAALKTRRVVTPPGLTHQAADREGARGLAGPLSPATRSRGNCIAEIAHGCGIPNDTWRHPKIEADCVLNAYWYAQLAVSQLARPRARSDDAHRYKVTRSPDAADLSMAAMSSWRWTASAKSGTVWVPLSMSVANAA